MKKAAYNFVDEMKAKKSAATVRNYSHTLKLFGEWVDANGGNLDAPTRHDVKTFLDDMIKRKLSASTLNARYAALRAYAAYIGRPSIVDAIDLPAVPKLKEIAPQSLTKTERNALLRKVEEDAEDRINKRGKIVKGSVRYAAIVNLLLRTGLRVSELVALDVDDVTINDRGGFLNVRSGKGNKSRRVPLSKEARYWLRRYMDERQEAETDGDEKALFLSNYRKRISVRIVQETLKDKYNVHPHMLRHSFASKLVNEDGAPITVVAEALGHSDITITNRYSKPTFEQLAEWIDK